MVNGVCDSGEDPLIAPLIDWFEANGRDLPWRHTTPWGVLVSEFMLQQTPVTRVIPVWHAWLERWPSPTDLAAAPVSEAIRQWGRLGYPRRAQRLHASATLIRDEFAGSVPRDTESLRSLPGVGSYTAAAVQAFAFGRRSIVLDTNIRRVIARTREGRAHQRVHLSGIESALAESLWPHADARSAAWSVAVMQFGALVCTARNPSCGDCVVSDQCAWRLAGYPDAALAERRVQPRYEGSDRQARGAILQVLRDHRRATARRLSAAWPDDEQRARALSSLVDDGLVVATDRWYVLA